MDRMTNLVMGWCNYTWDKSRIFVKSLRDTGYKGDIVFIEGTSDELTLSKYKEYGVTIIPCKNDLNFIFGECFHFLIYNESNYDHVFLSDVRDVVFQSNPFDCQSMKNSYLHLTSEDLKIKEQALNSLWIKNIYGSDILEKIGNETIICGGVLYGGIASIINWVEKIFVNSEKVEQAVLNYLFRTGKLDAIAEPNDGSSVVWTIGTKIDTEHDDFYKIKNNLITTLDDIIPPVIHQYDRHIRIKEMLEKYYADV
jgi:hypothetical protein